MLRLGTKWPITGRGHHLNSKHEAIQENFKKRQTGYSPRDFITTVSNHFLHSTPFYVEAWRNLHHIMNITHYE